MTTNKTSSTVKKKWSVRADCWPPKAVTVAGKADVKEGDMARPVQIMSGKRRNTTPR